MRQIGTKLVAFVGTILLLAGTAAAEKEIGIDGKITIDRKQLSDIVKEVIKDNPKLLFDTITEYAKEEKKKKNIEKLEASFKNRLEGIGPDKHTPLKGPEDAPIVITEFSDFQCPYCQKVNKTIESLMKKYPGKIRLGFRHNPLKFHDKALPAAKAAMAAHRQGKFWEYHDRLFEKSSELGEEVFAEIAKDLGLDMKKFDDDRNSEEIAGQVEADREQAQSNKLTGTPVFVANGVVIRGAQNIGYFSKVVDRLLAETDKKK